MRKYVSMAEIEAAKPEDRSDMVVTKFCPVEKGIANDNPRVKTFCVSDESVDRDDDVIVQKGLVWDAYQSNPVILFAHDSKSLPIGKGSNMRRVGTKTLLDIEFATAAENPQAEYVFQCVEKGYLNAGSLGFIPKDYKVVKDGNRHGFDITKAEVVEFSIVPVPANSNALLQMAKDASVGPVFKEIKALLKAYKLNDSGEVERNKSVLKIEVKDMYSVSMLADCLGCLSWVEDWQEYLGTSDSAAAAISDAMNALGQALIQVTTESVAELLADDEDAEEKLLSAITTKQIAGKVETGHKAGKSLLDMAREIKDYFVTRKHIPVAEVEALPEQTKQVDDGAEIEAKAAEAAARAKAAVIRAKMRDQLAA